MSETLAGYTIPNPVEGEEFPIAPGEEWLMGNGDEAWHTLAVRRGWHRVYMVRGADLAGLRAAILAAIQGEVQFAPMEGGGPYPVRVVAQSVNYAPESVTLDGFWRVRCTVHQVRQP